MAEFCSGRGCVGSKYKRAVKRDDGSLKRSDYCLGGASAFPLYTFHQTELCSYVLVISNVVCQTISNRLSRSLMSSHPQALPLRGVTRQAPHLTSPQPLYNPTAMRPKPTSPSQRAFEATLTRLSQVHSDHSPKLRRACLASINQYTWAWPTPDSVIPKRIPGDFLLRSKCEVECLEQGTKRRLMDSYLQTVAAGRDGEEMGRGRKAEGEGRLEGMVVGHTPRAVVVVYPRKRA